MPNINNVNVLNVDTGANWITHNNATVYVGWVACNANANNQPPVGFLNNPGHRFAITGNDIASGAHYNSGNLNPFPGNSEPPIIFAFH